MIDMHSRFLIWSQVGRDNELIYSANTEWLVWTGLGSSPGVSGEKKAKPLFTWAVCILEKTSRTDAPARHVLKKKDVRWLVMGMLIVLGKVTCLLRSCW